MARAKESVLVADNDARAADLIARQIIPAHAPTVDATSTISSALANNRTSSLSTQLPAQRMTDAGDAIDCRLV